MHFKIKNRTCKLGCKILYFLRMVETTQHNRVLQQQNFVAG